MKKTYNPETELDFDPEFLDQKKMLSKTFSVITIMIVGIMSLVAVIQKKKVQNTLCNLK